MSKQANKLSRKLFTEVKSGSCFPIDIGSLFAATAISTRRLSDRLQV